MKKSLSEKRIIEELKKIDTPTISNVVVHIINLSYVLNSPILGMDNGILIPTIKCMFPEYPQKWDM